MDENEHRPASDDAVLTPGQGEAWEQDPDARGKFGGTMPRQGDGLYRLLIERAADGIAILQDGCVAYANAKVTEMLGYSFEELSSKPFEQFVAPEERDVVLERYRMRMAGEVTPTSYEISLLCKDGQERRVEVAAGLATYRGRPADLAVLRDITERTEIERRTRLVADRIRRLHEVAADLALCDAEGDVCQVAIRAAEDILSLSICTLDLVEGDRLVVKATSSHAPQGASESRSLDEAGLASKTLRTGKSYAFARIDEEPDAKPTRATFESGVSVPVGTLGVLQAASTVKGAFSAEDVRVLEILARHVSAALQRIRLEAELRWQAIRDPLTGAFNRRYAREAIDRELQHCLRRGHPLVLLMVDINRFKEINDRFGHQVGDEVLMEVARVLQQEVRAGDSVIRYGGDEFLILMPEGETTIDSVVERMHRAIAKWSRSEKAVDFPVTLAVGRARHDPIEGGTWEDVLHLADRRMYEDKRSAGCRGETGERAATAGDASRDGVRTGRSGDDA